MTVGEFSLQRACLYECLLKYVNFIYSFNFSLPAGLPRVVRMDTHPRSSGELASKPMLVIAGYAVLKQIEYLSR